MKKYFALYLFLIQLTALSAQELKFAGLLIINEKEEQLRASYKLSPKSEGHYDLIIHPLGAKAPCAYLVKKLSAPQQTRGTKGSVFSNRPKGCQFQMENKEVEAFWNSVVLIDFKYSLTKENKMDGLAIVKSLKKEYSASLKFE